MSDQERQTYMVKADNIIRGLVGKYVRANAVHIKAGEPEIPIETVVESMQTVLATVLYKEFKGCEKDALIALRSMLKLKEIELQIARDIESLFAPFADE